MAYKYKSRPTRRRATKRRRFKRRVRRVARRYLRRSMTRRKVVDIASRKCHDNMITLSLDAAGVPVGNPGDPYIMTGESVHAFAFCPSARSSEWTEASGEYQRKMTHTYSRGYKEFSTFETGGAANWQWRRIVFTTKVRIWEAFPIGTVEHYYEGTIPTNGQTRALYDFAPDVAASGEMYYNLFEGTRGTDWSSVFDAKTNNKYVRVISDRTRQLQGKNDSAHFHNHRNWYPNNRTLIYNEKESGDNKPISNSGKFAAGGRAGEGDLYVVDFFACANGGTSNQARWVPLGKYYWHER